MNEYGGDDDHDDDDDDDDDDVVADGVVELIVSKINVDGNIDNVVKSTSLRVPMTSPWSWTRSSRRRGCGCRCRQVAVVVVVGVGYVSDSP